MRFSEIIARVNGVSTPLGGISWEPAQSDVAAAKELIAFMEDRRVLFYPDNVEVADHAIQSVLRIREFLTTMLARGGLQEELTSSLRAMRSACRKFLDSAVPPDEGGRGLRRWRPGSGLDDHRLNQALGELRGVVGIHLGLIAGRYHLDMEDELASILPNPPE